MEKTHIAVIGAGFSGTLLVHHLIAQSNTPLRIFLFEQSGQYATGVAYSTTHPHHLLNVRAEKISAFPDKPLDFVDWLQAHSSTWKALHPAFLSLSLDEKSFAPRMIYGAYLKHVWKNTQQEATEKGHEIVCLSHTVTDITLSGRNCIVAYDNTEEKVDAVVLAVGNLPSKRFSYQKKIFHAAERFAGNVWNPPSDHILKDHTPLPSEPIVILGSGLTMVDMVLSLQEKGVTCPIYAFSRHGQLPAVHEAYTPYQTQLKSEALPHTALGLLMWLRQEVRLAAKDGMSWQAVIDRLRPITNPLWQAFPIAEKRRFLKHLSSFWNNHRHRMPEESASVLDAMQKSGQLRLIKGTIVDVDNDAQGLIISYHQKYHPGIQTMRASYLLNCTGSEWDIGNLPNHHLLFRLREKGYLTIGRLRAGLEQEEGHMRGEASDYLFTLGPVCFGTLFETIAIPELRVQAQTLAHHLLSFLKERHTLHFTI